MSQKIHNSEFNLQACYNFQHIWFKLSLRPADYSLNYHIRFLITVGIFQYCILKLLQFCVSQISTFINCLFTTIINTEFISLLKMAIFHGFLYFTICILKNKQINKYKILIIALLQFTSNFMPFKNLRHQLLIKSCCKNNG